ncbi:radical SAM protein [Geitlerinema sp. P-1104]|uniref:radical SAM protein n=1 Tax=Geitlerinema sp. P-1104 TaxID=2546230 RepID=UPI001476CF54|nr:radical SAM protein [Geitlerinema sp. P-1104]NMG60967.1 radical SAM protein [Geitlerinema sp. P-1104]
MTTLNSTKTPLNLDQHPCFNPKIKGKFGRVHLPVAPKCNVQCNFCNRKYDCVNESRPGVTSKVLEPHQAAEYMAQILEKEPRITVAGIAGPGDPFANAWETLETMRLLRERFPDLILCLATNGMGLKAEHVEEIARIGVSHVTVTVNAIDPDIGAQVYRWFRDGNLVLRGRQGAERLLSRQMEAIRALKAADVVVKVNTVVIPGVNDHHAIEIAETVAAMGVDLFNAMPMYPTPDTPFGVLPEPSPKEMAVLRRHAGEFITPMTHCTRCRADAVGLLGEDRSEEFRGCLTDCSTLPRKPEVERPYVAVATFEGVLVNEHLGDAVRLQIWQQTPDGFALVEERPTPERGMGPRRWKLLADQLQDCRALLVSGIGESPRQILRESGLLIVEMTGFMEAGLQTLYNGGDVTALRGRNRSVGEKVCKGTGSGCG